MAYDKSSGILSYNTTTAVAITIYIFFHDKVVFIITDEQFSGDRKQKHFLSFESQQSHKIPNLKSL